MKSRIRFLEEMQIENGVWQRSGGMKSNWLEVDRDGLEEDSGTERKRVHPV